LLASILGCHIHSTDQLYNTQKTISEIKALHERVDKEHPYRRVVKILPLFKIDKFNVNEYFNILTHIKPPTGLMLDFVYYNNTEQPILYFRKYDEQQNMSYYEFKSRYGAVYKDYYEASEVAELLEVDGTPESYIELILFREYAGKFHQPRGWCGTPEVSAKYHRRKMIEKCLKQNEKLPSEDPVFVVERIDTDTVQISRTQFSAYSFEYYRGIYQLYKSIPHRITRSEGERTSACTDFNHE
jgi:hypothetical protein